MVIEPLVRKWSLVRRSCTALGVAHTARSTLAFGLNQSARLLTRCADAVEYRPERDRAFDSRFGTDTAATVGVDDLGIADSGARKTAVFYVASPVPFVRYFLRHLPVDHRDYHFVDFGCGKGRVLMVASEFPFRTIRGVEISPALCDMARRNLQAFRSERQCAVDVDVRCLDAREFQLPAENTVFHFYHPFEGDLLRDVLDRIATTFRRSGKTALIIYSFHSVESLFPLFEQLGFARLSHTRTVHTRYQFACFAVNPPAGAAATTSPALSTASLPLAR